MGGFDLAQIVWLLFKGRGTLLWCPIEFGLITTSYMSTSE